MYLPEITHGNGKSAIYRCSFPLKLPRYEGEFPLLPLTGLMLGQSPVRPSGLGPKPVAWV